MIFSLTGQVGSGKSLMATQKAFDYAKQGRKLAANFHIDFASVVPSRRSKASLASVTVLPSLVTSEHLRALGVGGPSEKEAGLVVLDEASLFLNSRTWNDSDRAAIMRWLMLSRKRCWDVLLLTQNLNQLDKQVREAAVELTGRIRRMDRSKFPPLIGFRLPRIHVATLRYGSNPQDTIADTWWARGEHLFKCYDTKAIFGDTDSADAVLEESGIYSTLPASLSKWRYQPLTVAESVVNKFLPCPSACMPVARAHVVRKPPVPVVQHLRRLPPDQALKHWRRLNALGAFDARLAANPL